MTMTIKTCLIVLKRRKRNICLFFSTPTSFIFKSITSTCSTLLDKLHVNDVSNTRTIIVTLFKLPLKEWSYVRLRSWLLVSELTTFVSRTLSSFNFLLVATISLFLHLITFCCFFIFHLYHTHIHAQLILHCKTMSHPRN